MYLAYSHLCPNDLFTMPHADPDSDSNSDCKPKGYIVLCRTFHTAQSQIQNSSQLEGTGIELELGSVV